MLKPTSGNLKINGMDCWSDSFKIKKNVSFLHEEAEYPLGASAFAYLVFIGRIRGMSKESAQQQANELLERLELADAAHRAIMDYSKGMKQLVGVASSFMGYPDAIVLDEPTANLDPNGRFRVLELVRQWHEERKTTFLISSHILHELERVCTDAGFIFKGQLVAHGSPSEILGGLPLSSVRVRTTKQQEVYEALVKTYPEMSITLRSDAIILDGLGDMQIQEVSRQINEVLSKCDAVMLELRQEDGSLEHAFKELARRYQ